MFRIHLAAALLGAAGLLCGCASTKIAADSRGVGPDLSRGASFALTDGGEAARPAAQAVAVRLGALGLSPATAAAPPRYLVETGFSARPVAVGAFAAEIASDKGERPDWLIQPSKRWWMSPGAEVCALSVRISEAAGGAEVYRVKAATRAPRSGCGETAEPLAQAALARIPLTAVGAVSR
ncbi:MAG: hypothetical protein V3S45_09310 [Kiloniellales bacterium]|nr:hypothetical protein [Caulobacteraceae bacterium]